LVRCGHHCRSQEGERLAESDDPEALLLVPTEHRGPHIAFMQTDKASAWVGPLVNDGDLGDLDHEDQIAWLQRALALYPTAIGWESPIEVGVPWRRYPEGRWWVRLQWRLPQSVGSADERINHLLHKVAPEYGQGPGLSSTHFH
jgi:hypothetical protein